VSQEINPFIDVARLVAAGIVGGLVATFAAHKLAGVRDRRTGINADKSKIFPEIERFITMSENGLGVFGQVRYQIQLPEFCELAVRFGLHLKGERLRKYNEIWNSLANASRDEIHDCNQPNTSKEEYDKVKSALMSKLEAFRKIVYES
jgi:hypothetical protein